MLSQQRLTSRSKSSSNTEVKESRLLHLSLNRHTMFRDIVQTKTQKEMFPPTKQNERSRRFFKLTFSFHGELWIEAKIMNNEKTSKGTKQKTEEHRAVKYRQFKCWNNYEHPIQQAKANLTVLKGCRLLSRVCPALNRQPSQVSGATKYDDMQGDERWAYGLYLVSCQGNENRWSVGKWCGNSLRSKIIPVRLLVSLSFSISPQNLISFALALQTL